MLKVIDVDKIEDWIKGIENYDYSKLKKKEQQEEMKLIFTAKKEAYQQVLKYATV